MNQLIDLFEDIKRRVNTAYDNDRTSVPLSFKEVNQLETAEMFIDGSKGGLVVSDDDIVNLVFLTPTGYFGTGLNRYSFILCPDATAATEARLGITKINQLIPTAPIETYVLPEGMRTINVKSEGITSRIILLNDLHGIIHPAATKDMLAMLIELNEAAIKCPSNRKTAHVK